MWADVYHNNYPMASVDCHKLATLQARQLDWIISNRQQQVATTMAQSAVVLAGQLTANLLVVKRCNDHYQKRPTTTGQQVHNNNKNINNNKYLYVYNYNN